MSKLAAFLLSVSLIISLVGTTSTTAFVSPTAGALARTSRLLPALATTVLRMADFSLDPAKTAIVLIEYQNEFASPGGKLNGAVKECMEKTNMLKTQESWPKRPVQQVAPSFIVPFLLKRWGVLE